MRKHPWFLRIAGRVGSAVTWICAGTDRTYYKESDAPFARWVQLTLDHEGREMITLLSPREARALAYRLTQQAGAVDEANRVHGNGADYADESPSVRDGSTGYVVYLTRNETEDVLRDMRLHRLPSASTRRGTDRLFHRLLQQRRAG